MSYIVEQPVKGHIYLYRVDSFWDKNKKQPRQRRTYIGKKDPKSRAVIPYDDIRDAREFGNIFLLHAIAGKLALTEDLALIFPDSWKEILTLAFYRICENKALYLCAPWIDTVWLQDPLSLPSPRISELLGQLGRTDVYRERFFRSWAKHVATSNRFVIFDITSVSSYAKGIDRVEWGYNRDHESLPQINLGVVYGEPSALPLCYRVYPGSIHDVSMLRNAVLELKILSAGKTLFVLDKGFYSQANIRHLLEMDFIIPLPIKTCVYRELVSSVKGTIRSAAYAIRHREQVYYGIRREVELAGSELTAHIYLDERRQTAERELLLRTLLEGEALIASQGFTDKGRIQAYMTDHMPGLLPYFKIRKLGKKYLPIRLPEKINTALEGMGLFVLVTNTKLTGEAILEYYRERDGVEKCFDSAKNNLFLKRLRVHSEHTLEGLLFIEFIALILRSYMTRILKQTKSLKGLCVPELISELRKLKQITFGRKKVLTEISKKQKDIFTAFGIDPDHLT